MLKKITFLSLVLLVPYMLIAGTGGKISGTVTDRESGDPLPGANVVIVGTNIGAAADVNGRYIILNVPVGTYALKASFIGYQTITISNLRVSQDLTTEVNFDLPSEALQVETLEIVAERPLVNKNATNSIVNISAEKMESLPLRGYANMAGLQSGVVQVGGTLFVRGGRSEETAYYVDGVYQNNAFGLSRAGEIIDNSVEEVQFQAGGFNAEYGFANSGLIFATTKTGGGQYKVSGEFFTDEFLGTSDDDVLSTFGYGSSLFNLAISGPVPGFSPDKVAFYFAGERRLEDNRRKSASTHPTLDASGNLRNVGGVLPNADNDIWNWNGNVTIDFNSLKFKIGGNSTREDNRRYINQFALFNSDRNPRQRFDTDSYFAKVTQTIGSKTFWTSTLSLFRDEFEEGDPFLGTDFLNYGDKTDVNQDGILNDRLRQDGTLLAEDRAVAEFSPAGTPFNDYSRTKNNFWGLRADLTHQQDRHEIKAGFEFRRNTIRRYRIQDPVRLAGLISDNSDLRDKVLSGALFNDSALKDELFAFMAQARINNIGYKLAGPEDLDSGRNAAPHPIIFAAYIQDKVELRDLVVNYGLRYDLIDTDSDRLKDPRNIVIEKGQIAESNYRSSKTHVQVSPRLGFSFPVTDQTVFHAQYGKFMQAPELQNLMISSSIFAANLLQGNFTVSGNPELKPEKTTAYEVGFRQQLGDNAALDITAFYKDIDDFIQIRDVVGAKPITYARFENGDFGTIKGFALNFDMRRTNRVTVSGSYTLQFATGTGSSEGSARNITWLGGNFPTFAAPLDFDQRHTGSVNFDFRTLANDGPLVSNGHILGNIGLNMLFTFGSGRRFTPTQVVSTIFEQQGDTPKGEFNSGTLPWTYQLDFKLDKRFRIGKYLDFDAYLWVINATNTQNVRTIVSATGEPNTDGWLNTPSGQGFAQQFGAAGVGFYNSRVNDPLNYEIPRQIRLGLLFTAR